MENVPNVIKSGDNLLENIFEQDKDSEIQIMSLLTVFLENAIKSAEIYTLHSKRTIISSKDISMALKRELFTFLDNEDIAIRATEIVQEYKQAIQEEEEYDEEYDEEDEEDDEEYEDEEDEYIENSEKNKDNYITNETEEFKKSVCNCSICTEINNYSDNWDSWKPTNNIETILYNGIQKIDSQFNLK